MARWTRKIIALLWIGFSLALGLTCDGQGPVTAPAVLPKTTSKAGPESPSSAPEVAKTPTIPANGHVLDKGDLEAFFDGVLPLQLERSDIAGASVLVMKDGQVLLQKGYGYADVKSKRAVDPNTTIFRLASISKLFTWVSVMQLEEQGKLNLDTDINKYLDFTIAPAFNKPITLRNLMTHTGGFEEVSDDIIVTDAKKAPSLRDDLIANQPKRLFPPGEIPAYSNYGVGLASYIVQRVSGEQFERYVQEHIFAPLGMTHSSFYQPLPKSLEKLPSEGYRSDTSKPAVGFEIFNPVGAGGLSSTASDMGRFGQTLLNGGTLDDKRILKPETLARMWTPQFQANRLLPPLCMGFYEVWRDKLHWIGHEGDLIAFHSLFFVEPTQQLVLFVSYNSAKGGDQPRPEIIDFFSDRYFPTDAKPVFVKASTDELKAIEGTYQSTRRADSTKLAIGNLFAQRAVSVDKDGVLHLADAKDLRGHSIHWKPIGKDLWQDENEPEHRLFAIRDEKNHVIRLAVNFPGVQMERVPLFENGALMMTLLGLSLFTFAVVLVAWLWRVGHRVFFSRRPRFAPQPGTLWLTWAPRAAAVVWLLLIGEIGIFFAMDSSDLMPPTPQWFIWFDVVNLVTGIAIVLSFFAVLKSWSVARERELRWITKVKFGTLALACVLMSWFAIHWHLIGPAHRI